MKNLHKHLHYTQYCMYMYLLTCTLYISLFLPMYIIQYLLNGMHIDVFPLFINLYESVIHLHNPEDNLIYTWTAW